MDEPSLAGVLPGAHDARGRVVEHDGACAAVERRLFEADDSEDDGVALAALHAPERRAAARTGAPPIQVGQAQPAVVAEHFSRQVAHRAARRPQRLGQRFGGAASVKLGGAQQPFAQPSGGGVEEGRSFGSDGHGVSIARASLRVPSRAPARRPLDPARFARVPAAHPTPSRYVSNASPTRCRHSSDASRTRFHYAPDTPPTFPQRASAAPLPCFRRVSDARLPNTSPRRFGACARRALAPPSPSLFLPVSKRALF